MFSGFFGKSDKNAKPPGKEAVDSRGLEVIEDDPVTAWGLWDTALAEQDSRFDPEVPVASSSGPPSVLPSGVAPRLAAMPTVDLDIGTAPTQPMGLDALTPEQRKLAALALVELHHQRIANTIKTLWGDKECGAYINKLIMNGGDGMGQARIGFNQDAVEAMLVLADLHDSIYGAAPQTGLDFAESTRGTGWSKLR